MPDAALHTTDPLYLRELVRRSGLTQAGAAQRIGIAPRTMRCYLSVHAGEQRAPYPVQYALECLAGMR